MPKTISSALTQHLAGEVTTLATCWKITRRDSVVQGFTDHVLDLEIDRVTYKAASGYGRIPDGQRLRALCDEHLLPKPVTDAQPGDILLMRLTRHPQHLAIVGDRGAPFSLIHAYADAGACVEHGADLKWRRRIVAAYAFEQSET
ncbi:MAG: DUF2163 domain-containing protein [Nitrospirota bacterium]|nr:DUF2163 domain-containing protein [Nitrospirota bacterium]